MLRKINLVALLLVIFVTGCDAKKKSPFSQQRWQQSKWQVKVDNDWYQLLSINGVTVKELSDKLKRKDFQWRRAIASSFTATLANIDVEVDDSVMVSLRDSKGAIVLKELELTRDKHRQSLVSIDTYPTLPHHHLATCETVTVVNDGKTPIDVINTKRFIDKIEGLIDTTYAYRHRTNYDYKSAFHCLRKTLSENMSQDYLYREMQKILSNFGDGHLGLLTRNQESLFLPFLVFKTENGYLALNSDRNAPVEQSHPFIKSIDGKPLSFWFDIAKLYATKGSPQFYADSLVKQLRYLPKLRRDAGLPQNDNVVVEFKNKDGSSVIKQELSLLSKRIIYSKWPHTKTQLLDNNIGYLRIPKMSKETDFIDKAMTRFKNTDGLVIDVRGNGGGRRTILKTLMPYFLDQGEFYISNVAKYRITPLDDTPSADGYLANRYLFPATSTRFTPREQRKVSEFLSTFTPQWQDAKQTVSDWHVMAHRKSDNAQSFHYKKPVIILMDSINFSATDIFLNAFKGRKGFTLLGQASGGGSARSQYYFLPAVSADNGWALIKLASMLSYKTNGELIEGSGVQPDELMDYSVSDLTGHTDRMLDRALQLLGK